MKVKECVISKTTAMCCMMLSRWPFLCYNFLLNTSINEGYRNAIGFEKYWKHYHFDPAPDKDLRGYQNFIVIYTEGNMKANFMAVHLIVSEISLKCKPDDCTRAGS